MTGEELGENLLQSVREMKTGKIAHATQVTPNEATASSHPAQALIQAAEAIAESTAYNAERARPLASANALCHHQSHE